MTSDSDRPPEDEKATQDAGDGAQNEEPPAAPDGDGVVARRLGDGGPSQVEDAPREGAAGSRPARAPHLDTDRRAVVTEDEAEARAIVTRAQRRRARRAELNRRQFRKVSFWGGMGFGLTGALAAFLSFFWPRGVQGFGGKIPVSASLLPDQGDQPVRVPPG